MASDRATITYEFRDRIVADFGQRTAALGMRPGRGPSLNWPLGPDFEGVLVPSWRTSTRNLLVEVYLYVGVRYVPLEREVRRLGVVDGFTTIQTELWNELPGRVCIQGTSSVMFQPGLDNDLLLEWIIERIRTVAMPWSEARASLAVITAELDREDALPGTAGNPGLAVRVALLAALRGEPEIALARLARHLPTLARRDDTSAAAVRSLVASLEAEIRSATSSS